MRSVGSAMTPVSVYDTIFEAEAAQHYPMVDTYIRSIDGLEIPRHELEKYARVLACPVKVNPPNWQHGRLVYSVVRKLLSVFEPLLSNQTRARRDFICVDIGTAKGFSAIMAQLAIDHSGATLFSEVISTDVIDPWVTCRRNTVAEPAAGRYLTLHEILEPFSKIADKIEFRRGTGVELLQGLQRVNFAFVDGKHDEATVRTEAELLRQRQLPGDVVIFDDLQVPGVRAAVEKVRDVDYAKTEIRLLPGRAQMVAVRR